MKSHFKNRFDNRCNKYLPLLWAIFSLIFFGLIIIKHEHHLATGQLMYAKLAPVDPRSLIQGDYMALDYELYIQDTPKELTDSTVLATVALDSDRRIMMTDIFGAMHGEKLQLKNPNTSVWDFYPASNSFMFAEGLAACYGQASYARLIVNDKGVPMLAGLVDDNLQALLCEQKAKA